MSTSVFGRILASWLVAIALIFNVLGYALNLYSYVWWFDRVLHCGTLFAMTFWSIVFLIAPTIRPDHARPIVVFCLLTSTGIAIGVVGNH